MTYILKCILCFHLRPYLGRYKATHKQLSACISTNMSAEERQPTTPRKLQVIVMYTRRTSTQSQPEFDNLTISLKDWEAVCFAFMQEVMFESRYPDFWIFLEKDWSRYPDWYSIPPWSTVQATRGFQSLNPVCLHIPSHPALWCHSIWLRSTLSVHLYSNYINIRIL